MTKEELKQIFYLNKEVKMWQKELETLQCQSLYWMYRKSDRIGVFLCCKILEYGL